MMSWLKENWRWLLLNLCGLSVMLFLLLQLQGIFQAEFGNLPLMREASTRFGAEGVMMLEAGKWSLRFLLICLSMTPLYLLFGWRSALGLRKSAGLWAFAFAALHFILYLSERNFFRDNVQQYVREIFQHPYLFTGAIALTILSLLAITSNRWSMRRLGKAWKRLHRFVYAAGILVVIHGLLATQMSKKIMLLEPSAPLELGIYGVILGILLLLRIPAVRTVIGLSRQKSTRKRALAQADR